MNSDTEGLLGRWVTRLQQYDFELSYKPGKTNGVADGPSRLPLQETVTEGVNTDIFTCTSEKTQHEIDIGVFSDIFAVMGDRESWFLN